MWRCGRGRGEEATVTETMDLRGIFPIVYTPFDENLQIDAEALEHLIEHLIAVGSASECHTIAVAERMWLAERTMHYAGVSVAGR